MDKIGVAAILLAVGLAIGGWFVGNGFIEGRTADRFVTVKGVAEQDVMADLALWPLQIVASANTLGAAQKTIDDDLEKVVRFLAVHGIDTSQVELKGVEVTDRSANQYESGGSGFRYIVQQMLMVRSDSPETIHRASQSIGDLVASGVVLKSGQGWGPAAPTFLFKQLNDLKPAMIAEATASAREAAVRFASDSDARIGGIRRANQGVFVILARDNASGIEEERELNKTVRVVVTIDYFLE